MLKKKTIVFSEINEYIPTFLQRLLTTVVLHRYVAHPLVQFVDLASLANVSVFIFEVSGSA